jgi:hypothetical protein
MKRPIVSTKGAALVPVDLAVGWGPMSDQAVLDQLTISQSARFFFYEYKGQPPIPREEIVSHATNLHLIPSTAAIAAQCKSLRAGELIQSHRFTCRSHWAKDRHLAQLAQSHGQRETAPASWFGCRKFINWRPEHVALIRAEIVAQASSLPFGMTQAGNARYLSLGEPGCVIFLLV